MDRLAKVRSYRLGRDTEEACRLEAAAFAEDYCRMGEDPRLESHRERRMERLIMWIARVVPALRFSRMGYVMEQNRRIASIVLFSRNGLKGSRWSIDAVGTHPDFQRQGMAKHLLGRVFGAIRDHGGESCTLKVRQDNEVAYRMYQGLGFTHFHTSRQMRLERGANSRGDVVLVKGLENVSMSTLYGLWRERMALAVRLTPDHVRQFKPVGESNFRKPRLIRAVGPWVMKLAGFKLDQWIVRREGKLVGTLMIRADHTGNRSHEIRLSLDPEWQSQLAVPLLQLACQHLVRIPAKGTLIEVGNHEAALLNALEDAGFEDMSVWDWLGVKVDRAMAEWETEQSIVLTT
ncbi:GNAT family N-acetyltransferase [Candidatus Bipolaricaulota bacterium]|nr:GNAT family N-acetyltransferase [Candidatus Bipolaricaulota bacterium]